MCQLFQACRLCFHMIGIRFSRDQAALFVGRNVRRGHRLCGARIPFGVRPSPSVPAMCRRIWITASLGVAIVGVVGLGLFFANGTSSTLMRAAAATFVGSDTCAGCHRNEADLWRSSSTGSRCSMLQGNRCWAISMMRASTITACIPVSSAVTENTWSRPMGRTASSQRSR
jgi:hypothetical protein